MYNQLFLFLNIIFLFFSSPNRIQAKKQKKRENIKYQISYRVRFSVQFLQEREKQRPDSLADRKNEQYKNKVKGGDAVWWGNDLVLCTEKNKKKIRKKEGRE